MPTQVLMPALSPTMEEGKLAKWLVKEGDSVAAGDVIAEIETDKATMEVEAVDEGRLGRILVPAGTEGVKVNTPIAVIVGDGEEAAGAKAVANGCRALSALREGAAPAPTARARRRVVRELDARRRGRRRKSAHDAEMVIDHHARGAARRHGRGNAPRRHAFSSWARKWPSTRAPTRSRKGCSTSSAPSASSTRPITE